MTVTMRRTPAQHLPNDTMTHELSKRQKAGGVAALYIALALVAAMPYFLLVVDYPAASTAADKVELIVDHYPSMYAMYLATYVIFGLVPSVLALALWDRLQRRALASGCLWVAWPGPLGCVLLTQGALVLELDRLTRRFGDLVALDALSFRVEPGQMFGFVGSNGAGKTTAMRIVMGVDAPDEGEVRWNGAPMDRQVRSRFGYMPEERGLYPKTPALRQLTYLARLHGLSKEAGAAEGRAWLERFGLGDRVDDPVEQLSLGNQQRVQLAAALVHDPVLLVLDEPFSGLDPVGVDALSEVLLERARQGVPVVFSSHQLELVERLCDAVAIIHAGRLVASGAVAELRKRGRHPVLRVEVDVPPGVNWTADLVGVDILHRGEDGDLIELTHGVDDQAVLAAAQAAGRVRHFGEVRPSLSELYREVVQQPAAKEVSR